MAVAGCIRNIQGLSKEWKQVAEKDLTNTWSPNIEGCCAEEIVAWYLNAHWSIGSPGLPDVSVYQVRCNMSRKYTDLCLRHEKDNPGKGDDPNEVYISVLSFIGEEGKAKLVICGWIWGFEGFEIGRRGGSPDRPPCYYVAREQLHPMSELPKVDEVEKIQQDRRKRRSLLPEPKDES